MILLNWENGKSMYYDEDTDHIVICSNVGKPPSKMLASLFVECFSLFFIIVIISCSFKSFLLWFILNTLFVLMGSLVLPALEEKTAKYGMIQTNETQQIYLPEAGLEEIKNIYGNIFAGNRGHMILHSYAYRVSPLAVELAVLSLAYCIFTKTDVVPALLASVPCFEMWFLFYHTTHKRQRDKLEKRVKRLFLTK